MILSFFSDTGTFFSENPLYLATILVVLLIAVIAAFAISGLKKKKQTTPTEAQKESVEEKITEETAVSTEEQEEPVKEKKAEETSVEKEKSSTVKEKSDSSQTTAEEESAQTEEREQNDSVSEKLEKNYAEETIYHVTKRKEDGKWQVKLQKGGKAIKLFNTQEEAYAYAKKLAGGKDGTVHLHKVSGQIRKYK